MKKRYLAAGLAVALIGAGGATHFLLGPPDGLPPVEFLADFGLKPAYADQAYGSTSDSQKLDVYLPGKGEGSLSDSGVPARRRLPFWRQGFGHSAHCQSPARFRRCGGDSQLSSVGRSDLSCRAARCRPCDRVSARARGGVCTSTARDWW